MSSAILLNHRHTGLELSYTGRTNLGENQGYEFDDGELELKLLSSGTLTVLSGDAEIKAALFGGGENGSAGGYEDIFPSRVQTGGAGGKGGRHKNITASLTEGQSYEIVIGGAGEDTTAFGDSTADGVSSEGGTDGAYAFDDPDYDGILYGAGGGKGAQSEGYFENGAWTDGVTIAAQSGGTNGGGDGAADVGEGSPGTTEGAGGGGGCGQYPGGSGMSGILILVSKEAV